MGLKLENEFVVDAPVDKTWSVLLDIERVSRCLPGATLAPNGGDGSYRGSMKIKLGPVTTEYSGTARIEEIDEDGRRASFRVQGKETRGQGTASATIRNRLVPENGSTRVIVESEVNVTGRPAQFGRGIMQDVAAKLLEEFARRLEREVLAEERPAEPRAAAAAAPEPPAAEEAALDVGAVLVGPLGRRLAVGGAVVVLLVVALTVRRRRPKGITIVARW